MRRSQLPLSSAGLLLAVLAGFGPASLGGFVSETADAYGVGIATVGLFTSALLVTHVLVQVPAGALADGMGASAAGAVAFAATALGSALAAIAPDPLLLTGARLIGGVGSGIAFVAGSALLREAGWGSLAQGLFGAVSLAGGSAAIAAMPWLAGLWGWRAPFVSGVLIALPGLPLALVAAWSAARARRAVPARVSARGVDAAPPAPPPARDRLGRGAAPPLAPPGPPASAPAPAAGVFGDRSLWPSATLSAIAFGLTITTANWAAELSQRGLGLDAGAAAGVGATVLLGGVGGRVAGGLLGRGSEARVALLLRAALVAGALGTVCLAAAPAPALAVLGGVTIGVAGGLFFAPLFTGAVRIRPDAPGRATGFVNAAANATALIATPLVGLGIAAAGDGRAALAAVAALWLVPGLLMPMHRIFGAPAIAGA